MKLSAGGSGECRVKALGRAFGTGRLCRRTAGAGVQVQEGKPLGEELEQMQCVMKEMSAWMAYRSFEDGLLL